MVNKERVRLLVEALRSGEFVQGRDRLEVKYPDGTVKHCCLGVACRVAMANGLVVRTVEGGEPTLPDGRMPTTFDNDPALLPQSVQEWYGFEVSDPELRELRTDDAGHVGAIFDASVLNDREGLSFAAIADAFERTYLND